MFGQAGRQPVPCLPGPSVSGAVNHLQDALCEGRQGWGPPRAGQREGCLHKDPLLLPPANQQPLQLKRIWGQSWAGGAGNRQGEAGRAALSEASVSRAYALWRPALHPRPPHRTPISHPGVLLRPSHCCWGSLECGLVFCIPIRLPDVWAEIWPGHKGGWGAMPSIIWSSSR